MPRELKDMTLEELWQLFPITLSPHREEWAEWAEEEIALLRGILAEYSPTISHIGSTSISGICAKPIVDILVEIPPDIDLSCVNELMEANGYICMAYGDSRLSFNKGYTPQGYAERVYHIHIHRYGDNAELRFRDYLRSHPDAAREYERLKQSLLPRFTHNRDGYTAAKTSFVKSIIELASGKGMKNHQIL